MLVLVELAFYPGIFTVAPRRDPELQDLAPKAKQTRPADLRQAHRRGHPPDDVQREARFTARQEHARTCKGDGCSSGNGPAEACRL